MVNHEKQAGPEAWNPGGGIFGYIWGKNTTSQVKSNKSQLEGQLATQPGEQEVGSEDRERLGHRTCKTRHF